MVWEKQDKNSFLTLATLSKGPFCVNTWTGSPDLLGGKSADLSRPFYHLLDVKTLSFKPVAALQLLVLGFQNRLHSGFKWM